jgi:alkylation response protein AidB-like acyl-CoA dehydrogenase
MTVHPALSTEIALEAGSNLFELAGTRSNLGEFNLDRHWRNARTHTCMTRCVGNTTPSETTR